MCGGEVPVPPQGLLDGPTGDLVILGIPVDFVAAQGLRQKDGSTVRPPEQVRPRSVRADQGYLASQTVLLDLCRQALLRRPPAVENGLVAARLVLFVVVADAGIAFVFDQVLQAIPDETGPVRVIARHAQRWPPLAQQNLNVVRLAVVQYLVKPSHPRRVPGIDRDARGVKPGAVEVRRQAAADELRPQRVHALGDTLPLRVRVNIVAGVPLHACAGVALDDGRVRVYIDRGVGGRGSMGCEGGSEQQAGCRQGEARTIDHWVLRVSVTDARFIARHFAGSAGRTVRMW